VYAEIYYIYICVCKYLFLNQAYFFATASLRARIFFCPATLLE
jgi:hypothetical protein